jgi:14-3-3 protein beta/theta/zeta
MLRGQPSLAEPPTQKPDKFSSADRKLEQVAVALVMKCDDVRRYVQADKEFASSLQARSNHVYAQVFYLKMHGDYWRYLAEVSAGTAKAEAADRAHAAYKAAQVKAAE